MLTRRGMLLAFALTAMGAGMNATADAQDIRYFVRQSTGLFEITGQATGGRFLVDPTGEAIKVNGVGLLPVRGRTDRASRGETVVSQIRGSGTAVVDVTFTRETGARETIFKGPIPLPFVLPRTVSPSSNVDNLVVAVTQNGRTAIRRLPIGTRP